VYLFHRNDLDGIVATLRHLFTSHLQRGKIQGTKEQLENLKIHEEDFRKAKPFLDPIFTILHEEGHWEDVLQHPPRRIEVALLPMVEEDRKRFPHASKNALTLFVSLPKGCIKRNTRRFLWGAHMPSRFHFDEAEMGIDWYTFMGSQSPVTDI
jgi:hypothetical protein